MKQLLLILSLSLALSSRALPAPVAGEYIVLVGGPSMHQWEQYKAQPHDHWWANFVHAARVRTEQSAPSSVRTQMITWLVYKPGYVDRGQAGKAGSDRQHQYGPRQVSSETGLFQRRREVINYLNTGQPRGQLKDCRLRIFRSFEQGLFHVRLQQHTSTAPQSVVARIGIEPESTGAILRAALM